ncbi:nucleotide sugar dehydrogenase [Candidatus Woesearchaeota archaeon]|jgi:nucleotide sugar dehydrogenase|nr:nucleotide sugar dehydrogenase [Candidatus Woesearchaeota archaeon]
MNYAINLKNELKKGNKKIGVWGLGYIGFSTITHFAKAGITCIGTDISQKRVNDVNNGKATIPNLDFWLGFNTQALARDGIMRATTQWQELIHPDVLAHIVTIPTEKDGKPHHDILIDVVNKLSNLKNVEMEHPPLVIVESTLTPSVADEIIIPLFKQKGIEIGKDILFGIAPRRDWFTSADKGLTALHRVVGGTTPETTTLMHEVLGIVCNNILEAHDHKHAAIVKSVENAFRQLDITFANQLSLAYPDYDMKSVLKMAGTKWNIETYHPSFGTGGYCIPLAPQYVLEGAKHPEQLTLLKESLKTDFSQPQRVVESLIRRGVKNVVILGIAYTGDLKVHVLSPAIPIAKELKANGINVEIHDPYYTSEEIKDITDCKSTTFPEGLHEKDAIVIVSPHMQYCYTNTQEILKYCTMTKLILDNTGIWNDIKFPETVKYYEAGESNWLG